MNTEQRIHPRLSYEQAFKEAPLKRKQLQRLWVERTLSNRMQASGTDPGKANAQDFSLGKGFGLWSQCNLFSLHTQGLHEPAIDTWGSHRKINIKERISEILRDTFLHEQMTKLMTNTHLSLHTRSPANAA